MFQRALALIAPLLLGVFVMTAPNAYAQQGAWRIVETRGVVTVAQPGHTPAAARTADTLASGSVITTGAGARAVLERGEQRMTMGSNARLVVAPEASNGMTRILQDLGSVVFQVDRRGSQHFRVETPLLAAVVKGTTFTVTSDAAQDAVHVSQGLVEVRALQSGEISDVAAGSTIRVMRESAGALQLAAPSAAPSELRQTTAIPAIDYAAASDGIIDGPASAQTSTQQTSSSSRHSGALRDSSAEGATGFGAPSTAELPAAAAIALAAQTSANVNANSGNGNAVNGNNGNGGGNGNGNAGNGNNGNGGANGNGNAGNGNNGNGGGNGNAGNGNNGNGGGNGNGNAGNGNNGNGGGNGNGNSGNGNNGNGGGNGNGNSGNGNNGNGGGNGNGNSGNGNSGNGNGQGDDD